MIVGIVGHPCRTGTDRKKDIEDRVNSNAGIAESPKKKDDHAGHGHGGGMGM